MKKILLMSILSFAFIGHAFAASSAEEETAQLNAQKNGWWPFVQYVFWPGIPPYTDKPLYGLRTGFPVSGGTGAVNGVEAAPLFSWSDYVYGFQGSPFISHTKASEGIRCSFINLSTEKVTGFQLAALNLNFRNSSAFELAAVNVTAGKMNGVQIGVGNYSGGQRGTQFGVFNMSEWCGVQFGLINIIEHGWLPFCPIFNISF